MASEVSIVFEGHTVPLSVTTYTVCHGALRDRGTK
jgi:hypothetical protein